MSIDQLKVRIKGQENSLEEHVKTNIRENHEFKKENREDHKEMIEKIDELKTLILKK